MSKQVCKHAQDLWTHNMRAVWRVYSKSSMNLCILLTNLSLTEIRDNSQFKYNFFYIVILG